MKPKQLEEKDGRSFAEACLILSNSGEKILRIFRRSWPQTWSLSARQGKAQQEYFILDGPVVRQLSAVDKRAGDWQVGISKFA